MSDASHRIDADELLAQAAWLRALARSLVADEHAADDVVQETFAAAIRRPPREPGALRGWLAKVARHAAWKSMRGDRRRALRELAAPQRAAEPSAADLNERIEMQRALLDAVQALDEPLRTVVVLRFYDGVPPREIAARLGLSPEVVWKRLSRAMAILRERLDRDCGGRAAWALVLTAPLGAKSAATASAAAAVGTGVAIVGTKTVVAAAALAAVGAWMLWPKTDDAATGPAPPQIADVATAPSPKPAVAPRARHDAEPATTAEVAAVPRATVRGRVVDAVDGAPLADARVSVTRKSAGGGFRWKLTTGADGTFTGEVEESAKFDAATPWSAVRADLYVEASARGHIRFYEGPFTTATGDDLGDIRLDRGVVVRGRVVHAEGRAAPGAHLYATAATTAVGRDDPLNLARPLGVAGDDGRFELDEALPVTKPGEAYTLLAASADGVAWHSLSIRSGSDAAVDVTLTLRGAPRAVVVRDAESRPVAGAVVTAYPRFTGMGVSRADPPAYSIAGDDLLKSIFIKPAGADGVARFDALPAEPQGSGYEFAATAAGFVTGWSSYQAVGSARDAEIEIRLEREQAYVVGARVVDADGRPVEGAIVTPLYADSAAWTTDAKGVFVLSRGKGKPFGRDATVEITKEGYAKRTESVWRWPDDGRPMGEIKLLRPAPIAGRVVDQDGRPVPGVTVHLQRSSGFVKARGDGRSDADGRFEFPDATEGEWALALFPGAGGTWVLPSWKAVRGGDKDVVVRMERVPEGRATVVVTVIDAEAGTLADVDLAMLVDAGPWTGRQVMGSLPQPKIERGRVTMERVRPGDHCVWLRVADRPSQLVRIRVAEGETDVRATCRVRRGVTLTGRVRLPDGVVAKSVGLEYALADGQRSVGGPGWGEITAAGWAKVAADGTFKIEGVTPATYRVTAEVAGWLGDVVIDATNGDAAGDIDLTRGAVVKINVPGGAAGVGVMRFETSLNGAAWTEATRAGLVPDRPFTVTKTFVPGTLRWRAVFRATSNALDPIDTAESQSGEVVLELGKETEIAVPLVPRR